MDEDSSMTQESTAPGSAAPMHLDAPELPAASSVASPTTQQQQQQQSAERKDKEKDSGRDTISIEDLNLPKSIITRLAKGVLPPNTQIQANAILALTKGATVFINHLANAANEHTQSANKKTIMPADVFRALDDIEYGFMRERLEAEFTKYNEIQSSKRSTYRKKVAAAKKAATAADSSMASSASAGTTDAVAGADTSLLADMTTTGGAGAGEDGAGPSRAIKKLKVDATVKGGDKGTEGEGEVSDAESAPDEEPDDDDDDEGEEEEEEEEDDDEDEDEDEEDEDEEQDEEEDEEEEEDPDAEDMEDRLSRDAADEALDDEDSE